MPSWLEVRRTERLEAAGKSPTRELLWSWAQQNTTVGDLLHVLGDMGHYRALQLFQPHGKVARITVAVRHGSVAFVCVNGYTVYILHLRGMR